jgi:hypothetical protein
VAYCILFDPTSTLSSVYGDLYASIQSGSNGSFAWAPELCLDTFTGTTTGQQLWDDDLEDGFDSGVVGVALDTNAGGSGGTVVLHTESACASTVSSDGGGIWVQGVIIRAVAQVPGEVSWSDVTVSFYNGDELGETVCIAEGPDAKLTGSGTAEQRMLVEIADGGYDRVVVSGSLRMQGASGVTPAWGDLFGDIQVKVPVS